MFVTNTVRDQRRNAMETSTTLAGSAPWYDLRWLVAGVVLAANTMDVLDATIVNVVAPSIHDELGGGAGTIQWLSAGYTLAFAVLLIAGARLGDIYGRRRMFLLGSAGFTLFSAACACSPDIGLLIAFPALQGGFGALMIPQGFGLMKEVFDDEELGKATRFFGPATGLALLGAPVLAGALIDANLWGIGWRLVFLINVPIGALALPLAIRSLPRGVSQAGLKLDLSGVWLVGLALVAIIYPLIEGQGAGWPAWMFALLAIGAVLLFAFLRYEKASEQNALIEPSLLSNRMYLSGIAVVLTLFGAFGGLLLCVSLYGQLGEGWSPIHAGLTLTPMIVGLLLGMGAGASFGPLFQFVLTSVNMREVGSASGVMEASQQLSTSLGVAVLGTIFFSPFNHDLPTDALRVTAWACLAPLAAAFILVFRLPMHPREEEAHVGLSTETLSDL